MMEKRSKMFFIFIFSSYYYNNKEETHKCNGGVFTFL